MTSAREIAVALGGHRKGDGWVAPCPVRQHKKARLHISEDTSGKVLVHCFRCLQEDVIAALVARSLWSSDQKFLDRLATITPETFAKGDPDKADRITFARKLWDEALPIQGTHAEKYLRARGYAGHIPATLRYHPELWHSESRRCWPALIGKVVQWPAPDLMGIQRIYLGNHFHGPIKAPIPNNKMSLGKVKKGAVWLGKATDSLLIAEGIETALCASRFSKLPGWAVLGAWNFQHVVLPLSIQSVVIAADHDEPGRKAAAALRLRLIRRGISCTIALPPEPEMDWADVAVSKSRRN